ncbi:tetratricopeptide repeat protein 19, mitochondrial isoform 1-T1 [Rhinophrynus dorsalis]
MKDEMEEAEEILHQALSLAQKSDSKRAVLYTYTMMANLAFVRGKLDAAEKLFKATMVHILDAGGKQDDNSFIEISLKLASIYASQNKKELALAGYQFCIMSLEEKIEKQKELSEMTVSEEIFNTTLLLGLSLDSYARYLLANAEFSQAQSMYEKALNICRVEQGELHPQTVTLMNDLATALDAQGRFDEAFIYVTQASDLARKIEHSDQHVVLSNLAVILMHKEHFSEAERIFKEALQQSEKKGDFDTVRYIQKGLSELVRKRKADDKNRRKQAIVQTK